MLHLQGAPAPDTATAKIRYMLHLLGAPAPDTATKVTDICCTYKVHLHLTLQQKSDTCCTYRVHLHLEQLQVTGTCCTHRVHLHLLHDTAVVGVQMELLGVVVHGDVGGGAAGLLLHEGVDVGHMVVQLAGGDDGGVGDLTAHRWRGR